LLVADLFEQLDYLAILRFANGDVRHGSFFGGAAKDTATIVSGNSTEIRALYTRLRDLE
jgi:hypothetical protein